MSKLLVGSKDQESDELKKFRLGFAQFAAPLLGESSAQLGQDLLALYVLRGKKGIFLEIGANHPKYNSNTWLLEQQGWRGTLVEPNPRFYSIIKDMRQADLITLAVSNDPAAERVLRVMGPHDENSMLAQAATESLSVWEHRVSTISTRTLVEAVLERHGGLDFVSIDIEGAELDVLTEFPFDRVLPGVFCIEHNRDAEALSAYFEILEARGYVHVLSELSKWDGWFVHKEIVGDPGGTGLQGLPISGPEHKLLVAPPGNINDFVNFFVACEAWQEVEDLLAQVVVDEGTSPRLVLTRARALLKLGRVGAALSEARRAARLARRAGESKFLSVSVAPFLRHVDTIRASAAVTETEIGPEALEALDLRGMRAILSEPHSFEANRVYVGRRLAALAHDTIPAARPHPEDFDARIALAALGASKLDDIDRHPKAGQISSSGDFQTMFNGLHVPVDGYYGSFMTDLICAGRGMHEPQEEAAFAALMPHIPSDASMIELGAYWGYYSAWFLAERGDDAQALLVEPDLDNLSIGQNTLALNFLQAETLQGAILDPDKPDGLAQGVDIARLMKRRGMERLDVLHADIQGAEIELLEQVSGLLKSRCVGTLFISTHGMQRHAQVLEKLSDHGYFILCDVSPAESYSFDGVVVARAPDLPRVGYVDVPLWDGILADRRRPPRNPQPSGILIDHTLHSGRQAKLELYHGLRLLGHEVVPLGHKLDGNNYIKYDATEAMRPMDLQGRALDRLEYRGFNLWHLCLGTLGYEFPGLSLETMTNENKAAVAGLFSRAVRFIDFFDDVLHRQRPSAVIVWGGMFIEPRVMTVLCRRYGVPVFACEFSFDKNRLHFDGSGQIGNDFSFPARWRDTLCHAPLSSQEMGLVSDWVEANYAGKDPRQPKPVLSKRMREVLDGCATPPLLLIGQCYIDTVISYDNPHFKDSLDAYRAVIETCIALEQPLIVKCHPGDQETYKHALRDMCSVSPLTTFVGLDADENIYALMDEVAAGITINSQAGLEMLAKGSKVLCLGRSFYAEAGIGERLSKAEDLKSAIEVLRRTPDLGPSALEACLGFLYHLLWGHLIDASVSPLSTARQLRTRLEEEGVRPEHMPHQALLTSDSLPLNSHEPMRILICHASPSWGGSGYYLMDLAIELAALGHEVRILCGGTCTPYDRGIRSRTMDFEGQTLSRACWNFVSELSPNVVIEAGVRTKPMRAALEVSLAYRAVLVVQAEDDEFIPFEKYYPNKDMRLLNQLDYDAVFSLDLPSFVQRLNLTETANAFADAEFMRWVEPAMRSMIYHRADAFTAIWHPMAERLQERFGKVADLLPPIIRLGDYDTTPLTPTEASRLRTDLKISEDALILFINGSIYAYSDEFRIFSDALELLIARTGASITLLTCGRIELENETSFQLRSLGHVDTDVYNQYIKLSDLICVPGVNDTFNTYRLSSRLMKAMVFERPIFTFKTGFAESLEDGRDGLFTRTDTPEEWSEVLEHALSPELRASLGQRGRALLEEHFDASIVAANLAEKWQGLVARKAIKSGSMATGLVSDSTALAAVSDIYLSHVPYSDKPLGGIIVNRGLKSVYQLKPGVLLVYGFSTKAKGRMVRDPGRISITHYWCGISLSSARTGPKVRLRMARHSMTLSQTESVAVYDRNGLIEHQVSFTPEDVVITCSTTETELVVFSRFWRRGPTGEKEFWELKDIEIEGYAPRSRN